MIEDIVTSILAFASTNIDDIFILTLFFGSRKYSFTSIFAGQFIGIFVLVGIGFLGALIGLLVDPRYIGLLGLFPIYLGISQVIQLVRGTGESDPTVNMNGSGHLAVISIAMVTVANGGDNIGVYVPLMATYTAAERLRLMVIFAVMVIVWCYAARYLSKHPLLSKLLDNYAHVVMPLVLFGLGIFILIESEAYTLIY
jgi:cadmium resistance protein CadD (predicted permease)